MLSVLDFLCDPQVQRLTPSAVLQAGMCDLCCNLKSKCECERRPPAPRRRGSLVSTQRKPDLTPASEPATPVSTRPVSDAQTPERLAEDGGLRPALSMLYGKPGHIVATSADTLDTFAEECCSAERHEPSPAAPPPHDVPEVCQAVRNLTESRRHVLISGWGSKQAYGAALSEFLSVRGSDVYETDWRFVRPQRTLCGLVQFLRVVSMCGSNRQNPEEVASLKCLTDLVRREVSEVTHALWIHHCFGNGVLERWADLRDLLSVTSRRVFNVFVTEDLDPRLLLVNLPDCVSLGIYHIPLNTHMPYG
ncbi:MAG: uncharacterized protein KVP18_001317 [Porospora cf. gigantea A]|nr:MAG: hypothetical protein KVP18_001317 [Porospora cf. gigantea A]